MKRRSPNGKQAEPTPAEPTPAEPTPAEPTPAEPTPAEPGPAEPEPNPPPDSPSYRRGPTESIEIIEAQPYISWEDRQRPRKYSHPIKILIGAILIAITWVALIFTIVALIMRSQYPIEWHFVPVIGLGVFLLTFFVSLFISLTATCPLCHGPPLHSRRCRKHRLANRWFPLSHRATVVILIIFTFSFRCMYCGTPFRIFKKLSPAPD